ncbi:hypothetical protein [Natrinema halophilum]|uniref:Uncharacterized protein n=1 Tax=Natrinema halophilum TaxID=1699371 RepID=A0A7D5H4T1_9EURY|nr:hypothetical protein [Natrinema halophilum]QLG50851.1 hypothetical protein HYG82_19430 [Natrinema halophilum]
MERRAVLTAIGASTLTGASLVGTASANEYDSTDETSDDGDPKLITVDAGPEDDINRTKHLGDGLVEIVESAQLPTP